MYFTNRICYNKPLYPSLSRLARSIPQKCDDVFSEVVVVPVTPHIALYFFMLRKLTLQRDRMVSVHPIDVYYHISWVQSDSDRLIHDTVLLLCYCRDVYGLDMYTMDNEFLLGWYIPIEPVVRPRHLWCFLLLLLMTMTVWRTIELYGYDLSYYESCTNCLRQYNLQTIRTGPVSELTMYLLLRRRKNIPPVVNLIRIVVSELETNNSLVFDNTINWYNSPPMYPDRVQYLLWQYYCCCWDLRRMSSHYYHYSCCCDSDNVIDDSAYSLPLIHVDIENSSSTRT
jgi:hypothetical protein